MFGFSSKSFGIGSRPPSVSDPKFLPNLQIWYNADLGNTTNFNTVLSSGDAISQWKDRSVFENNLNKIGNASVKPKWTANQAGPGNTLGVIRFDGVDESLNINPVPWIQSLTGFSLFIVAKAPNVGVTTRSLCSTDMGEFRISNRTNWSVTAGGCTGVSTVTGVGDTTKFNIYTLIFDGSGIGNAGRLKFRYNKVPKSLTYTGTASTITNASAAAFNVGVGSVTDYFSGDIGEIIMFTRVVNSSEVAGVESYLTSHWNL
jgi:hypothetical protein